MHTRLNTRGKHWNEPGNLHLLPHSIQAMTHSGVLTHSNQNYPIVLEDIRWRFAWKTFGNTLVSSAVIHDACFDFFQRKPNKHHHFPTQKKSKGRVARQVSSLRPYVNLISAGYRRKKQLKQLCLNSWLFGNNNNRCTYLIGCNNCLSFTQHSQSVILSETHLFNSLSRTGTFLTAVQRVLAILSFTSTRFIAAACSGRM